MRNSYKRLATAAKMILLIVLEMWTHSIISSVYVCVCVWIRGQSNCSDIIALDHRASKRNGYMLLLLLLLPTNCRNEWEKRRCWPCTEYYCVISLCCSCMWFGLFFSSSLSPYLFCVGFSVGIQCIHTYIWPTLRSKQICLQQNKFITLNRSTVCDVITLDPYVVHADKNKFIKY